MVLASYKLHFAGTSLAKTDEEKRAGKRATTRVAKAALFIESEFNMLVKL